MSCLCDEDRMFELCRKTSVLRAYGPIIFVDLGSKFSEIDHRLDRKYHPCLHFWATISICLMIHIGFFVKLDAYSMTSVLSYDRASLAFCVFCDLIPYISEKIPWSNLLNADFPCPFGNRDDFGRILTYTSDRIHARSISEIAIDDSRYVDIENISFFEHLISSGDAVTDDIIEGDTSRTRISSFPPFIVPEIVDIGRNPSIREDEGIDNRIKLERRHSWSHILSDHIERSCREMTWFFDSLNLIRGFDEDFSHSIFQIRFAV